MKFSLNPLTGFGVLDPIVEHASAKDIQQRGADVDREMFEKSRLHDIDMFNRESQFSSAQMEKQYGLNMRSLYESPSRMMSGLKSAGLNPILAATGGFRTQAPNVSALGASAKSNSPSRGSGGSGAKSNIAMAAKMGALVQSEADLNSAMAQKARAEAGRVPTETGKLEAETEKAYAEVEKAKAEARNKDASTEGILMDNVKKANLANVYDDAFGQFLTYAQEIGLGKILALGAMVLGPTVFARFIVGKVAKQHLPKIISLGNRFWRPGAAREFRDAINKLRGKN